jgi:nitrite reductase/ring-hydroxylating ferredoxin subunit
MTERKAVRVPGALAIEHGQTARFTFERRGKPQEGFVLNHHGELFAYANLCPHWNVDLDLGFGDFYDSADDRIFCRNHGALFQPRTGFCDFGPCAGWSLERFEVTLDGDDALVSVPEEPPYLGPAR